MHVRQRDAVLASTAAGRAGRHARDVYVDPTVGKSRGAATAALGHKPMSARGGRCARPGLLPAGVLYCYTSWACMTGADRLAQGL
jgi:hypothetical protein